MIVELPNSVRKRIEQKLCFDEQDSVRTLAPGAIVALQDPQELACLSHELATLALTGLGMTRNRGPCQFMGETFIRRRGVIKVSE